MLKLTKKRSSYLIILIISIIIFPTANESLTTKGASLQGNCSYSVEIETTCAPSAETTDHISIRFSDSAGDLIIVKHLKNPKLLYAPKGVKKQGGKYGGFARCAIDMFEARGACMSRRVCALYLKRFGSDGWRPGWVKVLHQQDGGGHAVPVSYVFYFRTFLPGNVWYGFDYCQSRGSFTPQVVNFSLED